MFKPLILASVLAIGCVQANLSDSFIKTTEVKIANPQPQFASVDLPPFTVSQSESVDFSDVVSQVNQDGNNTVLEIVQHTLQSKIGNFSFVDEVRVDIAPDVNGGNNSNLPSVTVLDFIPTADQKNASSCQFTVPNSDSINNMLLEYFSSGPLLATFTFTLSGHIPAQGLDFVDQLVFNVSSDVNKSINDL